MKHEMKVTIVLLLIFVLTQVMGLALLSMDIKDTVLSEQTGEMVVVHSQATEEIRPQTQGLGSLTYILFGIAVATALLLLIIRFAKRKIWVAWYALAVFISVSIALRVLIPSLLAVYLLSALLAFFKIWKPNVVVHNLTEILMYSGIALLFIPLFDILWAIVLLVAISLYDFIAVIKSKHMVKMAKFTAKSKVFPGIMIPYKDKKISVGAIKPSALKQPKSGSGSRTAVLGGGDVVFPLIFSGVVMEGLVRDGMAKALALYHSLIITLFVAVALGVLFVLGKRQKFYPAMPVISLGCLLGWVVVLLVQLLL